MIRGQISARVDLHRRIERAGPRKAARGKTPTDVWWHTIVPTSGREKTGYPTQKPLGLLTRIVKVHSCPGDQVCDFFAGSGTLGEAAAREGRDFILIDNDADAVRIMAERLAFAKPEHVDFTPPTAASHGFQQIIPRAAGGESAQGDGARRR